MLRHPVCWSVAAAKSGLIRLHKFAIKFIASACEEQHKINYVATVWVHQRS
jgi:hypothetical protein